MSNRTQLQTLGANRQCVTKYSVGNGDYASTWAAATADQLDNVHGQTGNIFDSYPYSGIWTISRGIFGIMLPVGVATPGVTTNPVKFGDASDLVSVHFDQILLTTAGSLPAGTFLRMLHNPSVGQNMTLDDYGRCGLITSPNLSPDIDISGGILDPSSGVYAVHPAPFDINSDGIADLKNQWPNDTWFLLRCSSELNGIATNDMIEQINNPNPSPGMARVTITYNPLGITLNAPTNIPGGAILSAHISSSGQYPAQVRFEYGHDKLSLDHTTPWEDCPAEGTNYTKTVTGLTAGYQYWYQADIRNTYYENSTYLNRNGVNWWYSYPELAFYPLASDPSVTTDPATFIS
jgi:hypothetical protein